jgi:transcriptional regulator with XRE-family HTH domain
MFMNTIGTRVTALRKEFKLNQKQFSSIIGISQGSLSDIEKGKTKPSFDTLISISSKFDVSTDWLLKGDWRGALFVKKEYLSKQYQIINLMEHHVVESAEMVSETLSVPTEDVLYIFGKFFSRSYKGLKISGEEELLNFYKELDDNNRRELLEIAQLKYNRIKIENNATS